MAAVRVSRPSDGGASGCRPRRTTRRRRRALGKGGPAVNARPEPNQPVRRAPEVQAESRIGQGSATGSASGLEPNRPAVAARPPMHEQRPSPFRASRWSARGASASQEHSADRRMRLRPRLRQDHRHPGRRNTMAPEARPPCSKEGLHQRPIRNRSGRIAISIRNNELSGRPICKRPDSICLVIRNG